MATLILTAVGTAVGGPVGGAIGAIIGQNVDQAIFAPKARQGPRLGDLAVQTSSYGTAIPKIFGTMRVAGTVIWSTDLIESRSSSGGGKGKPKTVSYSYSANFAVALSGCPVRTVRRIWADGKLLRGAAGDFKTATGYRVYSGDQDQNPDPLIVSAEGAGQAPAFRGIAYAVFENFQLEDYGNRIPSLTFEVEAEVGPVAIGAIAEELSSGEISAGGTSSLAGYAASGDSIRGAVEALAEVVPLSLADEGDKLRISDETGDSSLIPQDAECKGREIFRQAAGNVPGEVSIAYYDTGRDYQAGLQRAVRNAKPARLAHRYALPAALSAQGAKALAESRLSSLWAGRTKAKLRLGWRYCHVRPGAHLQLETDAGVWKLERSSLGPMEIAFDLRRVSGAPLFVPAMASTGRPVVEPDLLHGPTTLRLHDLPLAGESGTAKPLLFALAAGEEAGWRRAVLMTSFDAGATWQDSGSTAAPAVIGTALTRLSPASSALFDDRSFLEVELLNDAMWLQSRSDDALIGGANLALIGNELVQFGIVEALGAKRFRLSHWLRGRRGTEWAASAHESGESFALLETDSLISIEAPAGSIGGGAMLMASGIGDPMEVVVDTFVEGESLRPPSPVHFRANRNLAGDLSISWVRRSRQGWYWVSGSDTPLGEEAEIYRLTISGAGARRTFTLSEPSFLYLISKQMADGNEGPLSLTLEQTGTFAASRSAAHHVN